MSSWIGKPLGNVTIGSLIARGGMAEVYHGDHTTLNRQVAVKIMRDHVEEDPDSRARFAREARVVASLDHPNIIQIFDYTLVDGRPCIVMELINGAPLSSYLKALQKRGEKLPPETIAKLLGVIASAMDYAHERNIVHRDIKPANILLRSKSETIDLEQPLPEDTEPVLTDFGLVRLLDSTTQTSTGTVSGTPSYMSPEQARGDKVDRRTDIYSLGVVLYEMITGVVPFDAESSFGVLMKHLNDPPPPIPNIPADMQAVIHRALAKDPADRFETAGELAHEFKAVLEGKPISKLTARVGEEQKETAAPQKSPASPNWVFIASIILAFAVIITAGAWLLRPSAMQTVQDPNQPVGRITFDDFNYQLDQVTLNINTLPLPNPGSHYEAWLVSSQGGRRNIGIIQFDGTNGQLEYLNPGGNNLLAGYDQIEITLEPNDDPDPAQPSGAIIASSVFPPIALGEVRHLLVSIGTTPDGAPLLQGLWTAIDQVDTSVAELGDAFLKADEKKMRAKIEEIINQIAGKGKTDLYKDWNGDGEVGDFTDGFGILPNGVKAGYIPQTLDVLRLAIESPDSTRNIRENGDKLRVCIRNIEESSKQVLDLALSLQHMPFGSDMEALIAKMKQHSNFMLYGKDADQNGRIEAIPSECGADQMYDIGYALAEMPLLLGPNRLPPSSGALPGANLP
ncbi:MAG: protein kinase [Chloroflexi bacterium]|nr:protein kinase [Chloroflexota bacterium]